MGDGRIHVHKSVMTGPLLSQIKSFPDSVTRRRALCDHLDAMALAMIHLRPVPARFLEGRPRAHQAVRTTGASSINPGGANRMFNRRPTNSTLGLR